MNKKMSIEKLKKKKTLGNWVVDVRKKKKKDSEQASLKLEEVK